MTLFDKVLEINPEEVSDEFWGGVHNCPNEYEYLNVNDGNNCPIDDNGEKMSCNKCWNREYKEATS